MMRSLALAVLLLLVPGVSRAQPADPPLAELYALAIEEVFRERPGPDFVLLPSAADSSVRPTVRIGFLERRYATAADARRVGALLAARGYRGMREAGARLAADEAIRIVLGEVRLEPAEQPTFARLALGMAGGGDERSTLEVLLRREPSGWRVISVEVEGDPEG